MAYNKYKKENHVKSSVMEVYYAPASSNCNKGLLCDTHILWSNEPSVMALNLQDIDNGSINTTTHVKEFWFKYVTLHVMVCDWKELHMYWEFSKISKKNPQTIQIRVVCMLCYGFPVNVANTC